MASWRKKLSKGLKRLHKNITKPIGKIHEKVVKGTLGNKAYSKLAKLPGSMEAFSEGAKLNDWTNPYSANANSWDTWAGGTKLSQDPNHRALGRTVGSMFAGYGLGQAAGAIGGTGGLAGSTAGAGAEGAALYSTPASTGTAGIYGGAVSTPAMTTTAGASGTALGGATVQTSSMAGGAFASGAAPAAISTEVATNPMLEGPTMPPAEVPPANGYTPSTFESSSGVTGTEHTLTDPNAAYNAQTPWYDKAVDLGKEYGGKAIDWMKDNPLPTYMVGDALLGGGEEQYPSMPDYGPMSEPYVEPTPGLAGSPTGVDIAGMNIPAPGAPAAFGTPMAPSAPFGNRSQAINYRPATYRTRGGRTVTPGF